MLSASAAPKTRVWSSQDSTPRQRWRRRIFTIPAILIGFLAFGVLLIPAIIVGGIVDLLARQRGSTVRLAIYAVWWAGLESAGVFWAAVLWMRYAPLGQLDSRSSLCAHSRLQRWWSTNLVRGARTLLGMARLIARSDSDPPILAINFGSLGFLTETTLPELSDALAALLESDALRPRAVQGDAWAQYDLGQIFADGRGVPQDYEEALWWWRLAAEQGLTMAMTDIGLMYSLGRGVLQDGLHQPHTEWWQLQWWKGHRRLEYVTAAW